MLAPVNKSTKVQGGNKTNSSTLIKPKPLPINPLTKKPYNSTELKNKQKNDEMKKKAIAARKIADEKRRISQAKEKEFLANMDLSLLFPPPANKTQLRIVTSIAEERTVSDGGVSSPQSLTGHNYFVKDSLIVSNMRKSTLYPPFKLDFPSVPSDAEVNIDDLGHALIAKYKPPRPLVRDMK